MKYLYNTASPDRYPLLKELAAKQKKFPTEAESYLWIHIRNKQLGVKFNRQHIIGDYIVDFVCLEKHLIIEADGGYHNDEEQKNADEKRTEMLETMGFRVIRFDNEVILQQIEKVIDLINIELL